MQASSCWAAAVFIGGSTVLDIFAGMAQPRRRRLARTLYWWAVLVVRLVFAHPYRWRWERELWERDRDSEGVKDR